MIYDFGFEIERIGATGDAILELAVTQEIVGGQLVFAEDASRLPDAAAA